MSDDNASLSSLALAAATMGADAIRAVLRDGDLRIDTKSSASDFVTTADHAADAAIASVLTAARPADGLVSEESSGRPGTSGVTWIVDPLDGTMNFVHRRDDYAVSVGVERDGEYVAGALVRPTTGAWIAGGPDGARARDTVPRVTEATDLGSAMFSVGLSSDVELRPRILDLIGDLLPLVRDFRRCGSSAVDLMAVALGQLDMYIGYGVNDWDVAAGIAVVRAAGGRAEWVQTASGVSLIAAGTPKVFDPIADRAAKL